jgi:hypothetical protein
MGETNAIGLAGCRQEARGWPPRLLFPAQQLDDRRATQDTASQELDVPWKRAIWLAPE